MSAEGANAARLVLYLGTAAAASASPDTSVSGTAAAAMFTAVLCRLGSLFLDPAGFTRLHSAVAMLSLQSGLSAGGIPRPSAMAGVIEQANDVVTLLGLLASSVLLARKLIAKKSWAWALLPVGVVAVAGLVAVSDADTVNTLPPKGFWTGHEWVSRRLASESGPEASVAAALLLGGAVAEAMACLLLSAGWAWGFPLVAAFGRRERRGEGPGCCWPLALCLPGFDTHGTGPGIVLPALPVAPAAPVAGIVATGAASVLALAHFSAQGGEEPLSSRDGAAPPSASASGALSAVIEAIRAGSPPPAGPALALASGVVLALAPALVIAAVLLRVSIVAPTRCFALRSGRSQLAAAVAAAAVLAAVAAEASSPGSSGSAVASSGTQAIQSAFSAAWESTQPLRDGAADFSRPYWHKLMATPMLGQRTLADAGTGLIVAQFGLLVTALLFGFLPAMAIVGATYFALDNVWGLPDPYAGVRAMPRI